MEEQYTSHNTQQVHPSSPQLQRKLFSFLPHSFAAYGLILLSLFVIGYASYYFFLDAQLSNLFPSPPSSTSPVAISPTPDPTANWKTYISEDKSFSFKYPSEWNYETEKTVVEVKGKKYSAVFIVAGKPLTEEQQKSQGYIDKNDAPKTSSDFSLVYASDTVLVSLSLEDLVEELIAKFASVENEKTVLLNSGMQAKEVEYGCQASCIDVLFKNDDSIYQASTGPNADANILTLYQILSTFKFLDSSPTPTCIPRPACLDSEPRCMIPETENMCPKATPTPIQSGPTEEPVFCTQDAKLCPDGSYVGRTSPNCEFALCPQ